MERSEKKEEKEEETVDERRRQGRRIREKEKSLAREGLDGEILLGAEPFSFERASTDPGSRRSRVYIPSGRMPLSIPRTRILGRETGEQ